MVNNSVAVFLVSFVLSIIVLCSCNQNPAAFRTQNLPGWCVADTGAPLDQLQAFLDYGCHEFDCSPIKPGGPCFGPDTLLGHASWILDKFYREGGFCKKGLGFITRTNPSYEKCQYP
ncbi:glucan endo-1,3-beta-glucosidase-like isoform X1 [Sesamum indicum]|uniref:Glucan endo-1,3-beta-glucosidase-like isoform X1 n=1 Tax=Sesamum indicum TaxID=4182 RepID=A0A6I9U167_SESIN|nr:glucan endo-1,3-beta-glucosidase-like isoform X1 [Sesamum indicum]